ncbi:hypothetical protein MesoLjLc_38760 [Mesorhizobium sp. L-8-10]|uniref:phasin family protein n=1 Tax=Mesorhizobium sp. L-8-10 TaxID=2744523 RepID=UPI0019292613|nr:phasin family protein [Mesorhizobium sp. L-8-10]BCH31946.1 hypothetical protein MesoLjLc_38760 [Mesorhizobium sp. L-8-10]
MPWKSDQPPVPVAALPFVTSGQRFYQAAVRLQLHGLKAAMQYQIEALTFLKRRYEEDVKLLADLAGSAKSEDSVDIVAAFMQNASSDYAAEAGRIASIGARLATETAKDVSKEAERAAEDRAAATVAA